jgi:hypothetical protein
LSVASEKPIGEEPKVIHSLDCSPYLWQSSYAPLAQYILVASVFVIPNPSAFQWQYIYAEYPGEIVEVPESLAKATSSARIHSI